MSNSELIIDIFAGGGGASAGIELATGRHIDVAVNHDYDAILMHKTNHPNTLHLQEDIWNVKPLEVTKGRPVGLLWASPDCTHFSKARGGKPKDNNIRMLPWAITLWAKEVRPKIIIAENVVEIQDWCPLDDNQNPILARKGETFKEFIHSLVEIGYEVEWKELVAADYGAPTIRKRWYMIARCDSKPIAFPKPTHSKTGKNGLKKWVPVSTCLDFNDLGKSIFGRKKPLVEKTMNRIARGIEKFFLNDEKPFLIQYHSETAKSEVRGQLINEPIMTIDTNPRYALVNVFLTKFYKTGIGQSVSEPLHTVTTSTGHFGTINVTLSDKIENVERCKQISNFLIEYYGNGDSMSINTPLHTITTHDRFALVTIHEVDYIITDITLRMLKPTELFKAQGFPDDYIIDHDYTGKAYPISKQVARCGNSVVPIMAKVLVEANYLEEERIIQEA